MAALWMAQLGIQTRIIDRRGTRVLNGHADGFHPRTLEIFDSFDIVDVINKKSASALDWCAWVRRSSLYTVTCLMGSSLFFLVCKNYSRKALII